MEDIIIEIDKKVAVSFSKKFRNFIDSNGNEVSLNLQDVKRDVTEYLRNNLDRYRDKEVFSFVYDYDLGICITIMKPKMEYEVYTIIGILEMSAPEETVEDDVEKEETKNIAKELKEGEGV